MLNHEAGKKYDTFILTGNSTEVVFGNWLLEKFEDTPYKAFYCPMPGIDKPWNEKAEECSSMIIVISPKSNPYSMSSRLFALGVMEYAVAHQSFRVVIARLRGVGMELVDEKFQHFPSVYFKEGSSDEFNVLLQLVTGSTYRRSTPRIFLCHATEDKPKVKKLYDALQLANFEPWFDQESLILGDPWDSKIESAIRTCDYFMVCISKASTHKQGYLNREIRVAIREFQKQPFDAVYFFPILIDQCTVPHIKLDSDTMLDDIQYMRVDVEINESINNLVECIRKQWKSRQQFNTPDQKGRRFSK